MCVQFVYTVCVIFYTYITTIYDIGNIIYEFVNILRFKILFLFFLTYLLF